ncbi:hypothetical protein SESBI_31774, partial [Sesbania bispinosa]
MSDIYPLTVWYVGRYRPTVVDAGPGGAPIASIVTVTSSSSSPLQALSCRCSYSPCSKRCMNFGVVDFYEQFKEVSFKNPS